MGIKLICDLCVVVIESLNKQLKFSEVTCSLPYVVSLVCHAVIFLLVNMAKVSWISFVLVKVPP